MKGICCFCFYKHHTSGEMEYLKMFKYLWANAKEKKSRIPVYYCFHVISIMGVLLQPFAFSMMVNELQMNRQFMIKRVIFWMGMYAGGFLIFNIFHRSARIIERDIAFYAKRNFIIDIYGVLQKLPYKWHTENHSGNTVDRINKASDAIYYFGQFQANCVEVIVKFIGSLIVLFVISPFISVTALIVGIVMVYVTKKMYDITVPEYRAQNEGFHKVAASLIDYIRNATTVLSLHLEDAVKKDLRISLEAILPHIRRENYFTQIKCFINELLVVALNLGLIFYYIVSKHTAGVPIMVGSITAIFQYLNQFISAVQFYAFSYENIIHWNTNYNAIMPILDEYQRSIENEHQELDNRLTMVQNTWKRIEVGPCNFSYGEGMCQLKNIFIKINRGQKIAFIGESGAGKSTMLKIISGLIVPETIVIKIDGQVASQKMLESLSILIPQEAEIFENTIRHNITLGIDAKETVLDEVIHLTSLDEVLNKLDMGIDSDIRENGVNLSGGEKQRVALARGLYASLQKSIILLDEPTGSLDSATELKVYNNIFEKKKNSCVISVLHRLHLLSLFDYIYVFSEGKIVEEGTFSSLLKSSNGEFKRLWNQYLLNQEEDF